MQQIGGNVKSIMGRDFLTVEEGTCECGNESCNGQWFYINPEGSERYVYPDGRDVRIDESNVTHCPVGLKRAREHRFARALAQSGIGAHHDIDWGSVDMNSMMARIRAACDNIPSLLLQGNNLILMGDPGTGKTQAAVLLAKAAMEHGYSALVQNLSRVSMNIRAGYNQRDDMPTEADVVDLLTSVDMLWFDDLGAAETSTRVVENRVLYQVLDSRYSANKFTGVTTNLQPEVLEKAIGGRSFQRLSPYQIAVFSGNNYREQARMGMDWGL